MKTKIIIAIIAAFAASLAAHAASPRAGNPNSAAAKLGKKEINQQKRARVAKAKSAGWAKQRESIKIVDFTGKTERIILARGDEKTYQAHPTTVLLGDNKTMYCVWNIGHGGNAGPLAKSEDGGKTWKRLDSIMPKAYRLFRNCPSIYRIKDPQGKERLFVLSQKTRTIDGLGVTEQSANYSGYMPRAVSEDAGKTWRLMPPLGGAELSSPFMCIMTFSSMIELKDGSTLGFFHKGNKKGQDSDLCIMKSITKDGGLTWSTPETVLTPEDLGGDLQPCEPLLMRSPDGAEICCIMRDNSRINGASLVMFSRDEGKTWSKPIDTPWALSGDRHCGIYLKDGRILIAFREQLPQSGFPRLSFGAWLGAYDDIKNGKPGQYFILLSKSTTKTMRGWVDGYYSGLHQLPDGTIVATTYETIEGDKACSITVHRFRIEDIEKAAK